MSPDPQDRPRATSESSDPQRFQPALAGRVVDLSGQHLDADGCQQLAQAIASPELWGRDFDAIDLENTRIDDKPLVLGALASAGRSAWLWNRPIAIGALRLGQPGEPGSEAGHLSDDDLARLATIAKVCQLETLDISHCQVGSSEALRAFQQDLGQPLHLPQRTQDPDGDDIELPELKITARATLEVRTEGLRIAQQGISPPTSKL